jgi:hypothetical protein
VQLLGLSDVVSIAAKDTHSLFLKSDGTAWATGFNVHGQLGDGTFGFGAEKSTPVQVSGLSDVSAVAAGFLHSLFLKNDGTVWATGSNYYGQLGDGTTVDKSTPVQLLGLSDVSAIAAGDFHSLFLKSDGTVWATGLNDSGQLGDGTLLDKSTPVPVSGLSGVVAMASGNSHSLFLKSDGTVWATGLNDVGQLGDGTLVNKSTPVQVMTDVSAIAGGSSHSLFLKRDGTVWATGYNATGQLGDVTNVDKSTPVQVRAVGSPVLTDVVSIAGGLDHSLFLKRDETIWATGRNDSGQLGDETVPGGLSIPKANGFFLGRGLWIPTDSDRDGLADYIEVLSYGSDRFKVDSSGDGVLDSVLFDLGLNPYTDVSAILSVGEAEGITQGMTQGITQGVDQVLAAPASYSLYYLSEIADLRPGSAMIEIIGGDAIINMIVEESDDLINWYNTGETSSVTLPAPSPGVKFFRFGD